MREFIVPARTLHWSHPYSQEISELSKSQKHPPVSENPMQLESFTTFNLAILVLAQYP